MWLVFTMGNFDLHVVLLNQTMNVSNDWFVLLSINYCVESRNWELNVEIISESLQLIFTVDVKFYVTDWMKKNRSTWTPFLRRVRKCVKYIYEWDNIRIFCYSTKRFMNTDVCCKYSTNMPIMQSRGFTFLTCVAKHMFVVAGESNSVASDELWVLLLNLMRQGLRALKYISNLFYFRVYLYLH